MGEQPGFGFSVSVSDRIITGPTDTQEAKFMPNEEYTDQARHDAHGGAVKA